MAAMTTAVVMRSMKLNVNAVIRVRNTVLTSMYQVLISATAAYQVYFFYVEMEYDTVARTDVEVSPGRRAV